MANVNALVARATTTTCASACDDDAVDQPTASASIEIEAPASLVYEIVSDVARIPEWAAETERCRWVGGATGPAVGAKFRGTNRYRTLPWTTTCKVTAADPGKRFAFDVYFGVLPTARWEYLIEPAGPASDSGRCRVTESTWRLVPKPISTPVNLLLGIRDRDAHNQHNIETTLGKLEDYAETRARARSG